MIENKLYSYGMFAKYRGAFTSLLLVLTLFIIIKLLSIEFPKSTRDAYIALAAFLLFFSLHLWWDLKILANHSSVLLKDNQLIFYDRHNQTSTINLNNIAKIEKFPTPNNIYDSDFVDNMMSSGIRLIMREGGNHLIFSKINGYKEIEKRLISIGLDI